LRGRSGRSREKPTIGAVAKRAQVAISTVSRVLNGGSASERIRQRVEQAIRELGYVPSVAAQSLVARRTGCLGLAVNSTQGPWFSQIITGVEEAIAPSRYSLLLGSMRLSGRYDPSAVSAWIQERRVDGLIFVRYASSQRPLFEAAARANLPVVLLAPDTDAPADYCARCNNAEAGWLVAEHLSELGHRSIAFAGGPRESHDTQARLQGLSEGLKERGIDGATDVVFSDSYYASSGIAFAEKFLATPAHERPTAIVLGSDAMALGFMGAVARHGVSVPDDVSVVGFDGVPEGGLVWPTLTTVVQPTRQMAASACRALLERVRNPAHTKVATEEFSVELLVRESSGPVRR
jgi:DNA-binding LacI/PurR family transcriptional regulator